MTINSSYCEICGNSPYNPSTKHPEVCKKCESDVYNCVICHTKITENGQAYSFITTQPQLDEISNKLGYSRDYTFKPASYVDCIEGLPDEIKATLDELDIKMYNENLSDDVRTKARKDLEILEKTHIHTLIGFIELWLCSSCEGRLERINREFAMKEVLSFLKNSDPADTQMVNELVQLINGDIDSSDIF